MSDQIKHECGIALIRLKKPLEHYLSKYGTAFYGINKLYLLMEKQHNRGQDGAGAACVKFDLEAGKNYINRKRSIDSNTIKDIFSNVSKEIDSLTKDDIKRLTDVNWLKKNVPFSGELFLGHLRYGTFGQNGIESCHPFIRNNNWKTKNLVLAGNFNLTNIKELFKVLIDLGQHPVNTSDTITIMEKIGYYLDVENERIFKKYKKEKLCNKIISEHIANELNVLNIIKRSAKDFDGGFVIAGLIGHGDAFVMRDACGIRPAYYYADDEVVVAASERPAIMTVFNVNAENIKELEPGHTLIIKKNGNVKTSRFTEEKEVKKCSFERIYFSRGTDNDIYKERKNLGKTLVPAVLKTINYDLENTVFSYIPNTASFAFHGFEEELNVFCNTIKKNKIKALGNKITNEQLDEILELKARIETIAVKDAKLRTFIIQDNHRDDLVEHIYDVVYGCIREGVDNLVVLDDSIVRGTTLRKSILKILDRLGPKMIVVVSSAPQIRYPDCYGIDMAKLSDFIAFKAAIALLKDTNQESVIHQVYQNCLKQEKLPKENVVNCVRDIYKPFTPEQISDKIAELLNSSKINAKVKIVYQLIEDLHEACPNHLGDWYFTGNYPTKGGNLVANRSFINFIEGKNERAY